MNTREILERQNGHSISEEEIAQFADMVGDTSPVHRDENIAREIGFKDIPVVGVHLAVMGGGIAQEIAAVQRTGLPNTPYMKQDVTFRDAVYPSTDIRWDFIEPPTLQRDQTSVNLKVIGDDKPKTLLRSTFYTQPPQVDGIEPEPGTPRYTQQIEIPEDISAFRELTGNRETPEDITLQLFAMSRIPSTLLELLDKVNTKIGGPRIYGKNRGMETYTLDQIQPGLAEVIVFPRGNPRKMPGNQTKYTFNGAVYQNGIPRVASRITSILNGQFDQEQIINELNIT